MMNWISEEEPSNVPSYPFTNIGVGGLVVDDENNVLVIQEKYSPVAKKLWKFPGGHADKGENFYTTAEREVLEETGVKTKFESVIVFRHLHKFQFDASDIYIVCSLKPTDKTDVAECVHEIEAVKWLPMEEALKELSGFNQYVLRKYLLFKEKGIKISVDEIDHILGGKTPVYTLQLDSNSSL
ncbi:Nudix hydrolase 8 [Halotydeus destructor]|nr:Nudix hydrolase 8 [Halotydeus destructor]